MALQASDVFVVQQQASGEIRKVTAQALNDYLESGDTVVYRGVGDFTDLGDSPATPQSGDLWVNNALAAGNFAWLPAPNPIPTVQPGDRCIYDGAKWDIISSGGGDIGVEAIDATLPIEVNDDDPSVPIISINAATTTTFGSAQLATQADVDASATNRVVTADLLKVVDDKVDAAVAGGVTSISGADPIEVDNTTSTTPVVKIKDASTIQKGSVTLATQTDVDNGEAGKVVTADLLKTAANGKVTTITGVDPIEVDVATDATEPAISIKDAAVSQKGAIAKFDTTVDIGGPVSNTDEATWKASLDDTGAVTIKAVGASFLLSDFSEYPDA